MYGTGLGTLVHKKMTSKKSYTYLDANVDAEIVDIARFIHHWWFDLTAGSRFAMSTPYSAII